MAIFIPVGQTGNYHGSRGEELVYEAFKQLPDDYFVFYSVKWGEEVFGHRYRKGEADFLLFDPKRGFLVIEVKTGGVRRESDGRWIITRHDGVEKVLSRSPLDQAWASVTRFKQMIDESSNSMVRNYRVIPTVWFPSLSAHDLADNLPTEYQAANTFSEADLELAEAAVNRAFNRNNMPEIINNPSKALID